MIRTGYLQRVERFGAGIIAGTMVQLLAIIAKIGIEPSKIFCIMNGNGSEVAIALNQNIKSKCGKECGNGYVQSIS